MNEQKHIIGREVLEITVPTRQIGMSVQNRLSEITRQKLNPALNKVFAKLSSGEQTIKIDKLTIDLGLISPVDLNDEFVQLVSQQVELQIKELIIEGQQQTDQLSRIEKEESKKEKIEIEASSLAALNQFIFFLRKGYFSWQYSASGKKALDKLFDQVIDFKKEELKHQLQPVLTESAVKKRMTFQLSRLQLERLFIKLDESAFKKVHNQFKVFFNLLSSDHHKDQLSSCFYDTYLDFKNQKSDFSNKGQSIQFLKEIILKSFSSLKQEEREKLLTAIAHKIATKKTEIPVNEIVIFNAAIIRAAMIFPQPGKSLIESIMSIPADGDPFILELIKAFTIKHKPPSNRKQASKKTADFYDNKNELKDPETLIKKDDNKDKIKETEPEKTYPADDTEQVFVHNAGLVLLHPFMRFFFEGVKLLDKNLRFKNIDSQFKAIHLLQYIATGQESVSEYELTLNKILCGVDLLKPIPKMMELTKKEKAECNHLISTVLDRWDALKTKKPAALRQTYLQREGVLIRTGQGWNLNIERNTFDVMLEKLPWSFSIIRFPWSDQMINVEW